MLLAQEDSTRLSATESSLPLLAGKLGNWYDDVIHSWGGSSDQINLHRYARPASSSEFAAIATL